MQSVTMIYTAVYPWKLLQVNAMRQVPGLRIGYLGPMHWIQSSAHARALLPQHRVLRKAASKTEPSLECVPVFSIVCTVLHFGIVSCTTLNATRPRTRMRYTSVSCMQTTRPMSREIARFCWGSLGIHLRRLRAPLAASLGGSRPCSVMTIIHCVCCVCPEAACTGCVQLC
jgi:hypothetical protein